MALACSPDQLSTQWILSQWKHQVVDNTEMLIALVALKFTPDRFLTELEPYAEVCKFEQLVRFTDLFQEDGVSPIMVLCRDARRR